MKSITKVNTDNTTKVLLKEKFLVQARDSDVNWPSQLGDLTPLDCFLLGHLKSQVTTNQRLKDDLIRSRGNYAERSLKILTNDGTCAS